MLALKRVAAANGFRRFSSLALPQFQELLLADNGSGVVTMELNRPQRLHSMSEQMGGEIIEFCKWASQATDPPVRCVVVSGAMLPQKGVRSFSTGRDLKLSESHTEDSQRQYYMSRCLESVLAVKRLPVPTIAAVDGPAFGWGAELALACDLRLFSPEAILCFPETGLGIFPGAAGCALLPQVVPAATAKELIFTAARISGRDAATLGLGRVVEGESSDDHVMREAMAVAAKIAANAPLGVRGAKQVLTAALDQGYAEAERLTRVLRPPLSETEDFAEGLASFREKRKPCFRGR
eukprot:TRINITY_DN101652_c0_g1_i1.p1 TRINITY_DN101652_c0_g1~~TRINITY_DN101652_c0_g1_i1.p1  ORF type:complete len:294 (-),score=35.98 TRINITY_DN101652_c0_g1_i1:178-1059(-)